MSTIIRLLVLSFFATSLLLFSPSAYAQKQTQEAPKILYQVNGKISSRCCTKKGYKPAEYTALGENVSWGTSEEELGRRASTAGSAGDGSYSITHVAKMDDPGGLLADIIGYGAGEYEHETNIHGDVKIFVREGSASRYSITQANSGSLKADANNL